MPIEVVNATYIYMPGTPFETRALDGVSLSIADGEFVGVIGHTGSGKSTLVQHLNALLKPTLGSVYVNGLNLNDKDTNLRDVRRAVGLVFQYPEYQLFEETVRKDIAFGPNNLGLDAADVEARVREAAQIVGLSEDFLTKSPFELSGGEKRRVAIAGVIAMDPDVLVLDEPTAGLDPRGRDVLLTQITSYHKTRGNTVLLVSHSMEDIARTADRILVMNDSHAAMFAPTREVFARGAELERMGLRVPQITKILSMLRERGWPVGTALTMEEAVRELLPLLEKGGVRA